jgi:GxxExxY protein
MADDIVEKELSFQIMKAAFEVHNELGPGFLESIYEEAMTLQLRADGHTVETQMKVPVFYKEQKIGEHILDQVVDGKIILELKTVSQIAPIHEQQALSYLKATGLSLAIIINFATPRVTYSRVVNVKGKSDRLPAPHTLFPNNPDLPIP